MEREFPPKAPLRAPPRALPRQTADPRDKEFPKKKKKTPGFSQNAVFPSKTNENDCFLVVFISFAREN